MIIATNGKGKNYEEYKIIRYKHGIFNPTVLVRLMLNTPLGR